LDNITAGFQDSTMNIIAARPSMGKTALALGVAKHTDKTVGIMSLETSYRSIGQRLIISEAKVDGHKALRGKLSASEIEEIQNASERLMDKGIIVDDSTSVTAENIRIKAKSMSVQHGIDMLVVDFLQLMDGKGENENQRVSSCSRACKLLCKELDIPVIILSQLSRSCEKRSGFDKRPQLSDLRDSGAIEQDADVVISLFRPEYYGLDEYPDGMGKWAGKSTEGIAELIVNKQKDGPTGLVRQLFNKETMTFSNLTATEKIKSEAPF